MTYDEGRIEPTKRQARIKKEDGPTYDGSGLAKVGTTTECRRTRLITVSENLSPSFPLGTLRWMCGLVRVDVVMLRVYWEKK